jgi:site-specific DNA recombinase
MTVRAAGYVRVSTQDQAEHGLNLNEDRTRVREKCEAEGWELVQVFDDGAAQGDDPNRPQLLAMLGALDEFDVVILRSIERLSRDPMIHGLATNAFRSAGVRLESFITGPIDIETPQGEFTSNLFAAIGKFEKRLTGQRVKQAMQARARAGLLPGGNPAYGYAWQDKTLVKVPAEASVVERVFTDYASGVGMRGVARALNDDGLRTPNGSRWVQSAVSRMVSNPVYAGKLPVRDDAGEPLPGKHEPIVSAELWDRVQAIRTGALKRQGGRHADGAHLLVRGALRCSCGAAMLPRKARPGVERERYTCAGRIADRTSCSQPSIRREKIDEPLLAAMLDGYVDFDATRRRIEERTASALTLAREALEQAEREAASVDYDRRLARATRGWQDEVIDDGEYACQRAELNAERESTQEALRRSQAHVAEVEQGAIPGDSEQALLDHLAALKKAVGEGVGSAPDLHALRNVIAELFERIELVRSGDVPSGDVPMADDAVGVSPDFWLHLVLRASSVDSGTFKPIGQAMPVGSIEQYPPSVAKPFLARYCWW